MKKTVIRALTHVLAILCITAVFSGCASTIQSESDSLAEAVKDTETVSACLYSEDEDVLILSGGNMLADMIAGDWQKRSGIGDGEKVLSVTVSTQYEVCFFDDGTAMIYYGYCGVFEKDRQYFDVSLDAGLDALLGYVKENGIVIKCNSESFAAAIEKTDKINAFTDDDSSFALSDGKELAALMHGDWEKRSDKGNGKKILTVELPMEYGVSFFDDDTAVIYCTKLNKGRQYFGISLDTGVDSLVKYVKENGTVIEDGDETTAK